MTEAEYLAFERASETKHEYVDGDIYATTGASYRHNLLNTNLTFRLMLNLQGKPCRVLANDMRVKVSETGLYTYPDLVVVCGRSLFDDAQTDTLLNPTLIVEILSPSTAEYDRTQKFAHYRTLESLRAYMLVAQDEPRISHYLRQEAPDDPWTFTEAAGLDAVLKLPALGFALPLVDAYAGVSFDDPPAPIAPPSG